MLPPGAVKPDYSGYCLSNIPSTVLSIFGSQVTRPILPKDALGNVETSGVENVILILCDGLGYREFRRQTRGFLGALSEKGNVRPITTVFPSTTAAALTTISTGLTPQEHGLPEWFVYIEELDDVIATLPFSRPDDRRRDSLDGWMDPRELFDGPTIYQLLRREGVNSFSLTSRNLGYTAYSVVSHAGSEVVPYITAADMAVSLRRIVEKSRGRNLFYVYWSFVDTIEHAYGPDTDEAEVEASLISHALEEGFLSKMPRDVAGRTLIILTADHGQLTVTPEKTLYVNRLKTLMNSLGTGPTGRKIPPWGSARDMYLEVEEAQLERITRYLEKKLENVATVIRTDEAIDEGLFGINKPTRKFRRRVGNLMVLPHGADTVWYRYRRGESLEMKGHHGGLTGDEMTIPLAAARVSDLL